MSTEVEAKENGVVEDATPQYTDHELAIMKMRHFGAQSGKGFRQKPQGANHNGKRLSKADTARIAQAYQTSLDKYFELDLETLEGMIKEGVAYEGDKKLTGSHLQAFVDSYRFKLNEKAAAEAEEAKLKAEVEEKEALEKSKEDIPQITGKDTQKE